MTIPRKFSRPNKECRILCLFR